MKERYRLVLSNRTLYREVEVSSEVQSLKIGTGVTADVRLLKEQFFEGFELTLAYENAWILSCSDNLYISVDEVRKLFAYEIKHGDVLSVRYQSSNNELLKIEFLIDFEYEQKKYDKEISISGQSMVKIGGTPDCNIRISDQYVGNDSILLRRQDNSMFLSEISTQYGMFINGIRKTGEHKLEENDFFSIAGYSFCIKGEKLYTDSSKMLALSGLQERIIRESTSKREYPKLNRSTRIYYQPVNETIQILDPPEKEKPRETNVILSILPALAMLIVTVLVRGIMSSHGGGGGAFILISVVSMSVGIGTTLYSFFHGKKASKQKEAKRVQTYSDYMRRKEGEIQQKHTEEVQILEKNAPRLEEAINSVWSFDGRLFERTPADPDFLSVRIGEGIIDSSVQVTYNKQDRIIIEDDLLNWPAQLEEKYKKLPSAPISLGLSGVTMTGIVGGRAQIYETVKSMIIDLSVRHFFQDVKIGLIVPEKERGNWEWIRWLRHVNNENGSRNLAYDRDSTKVFTELLYKILTEREEVFAGKDTPPNTLLPNYVIFITEYYEIMSHPISRFFTSGVNYGVSFVFCTEAEELLPNCERIVNLLGGAPTVTDARNGNDIQQYMPVQVPDLIAAKASMKLACMTVDEVSLASQLTKSITLYKLLGIFGADDIDFGDRWQKSEVYKTLAAPLGVDAKNDIVYLNLHEKAHGPHGLVAGTTGSGKSEIMQSYILSMATLYHPYEVGFVIIDFKGGGMVNQFKDLPHLIGSITDIDGREIDRSLSSIRAELNKRKELFAEAGVNKIDAYIRKYRNGQVKTPLPHLILIVDEFAELKAEQPEFMKELISTARIGRSLGVHLILATQKPSGVVDAQIWSNSRFRLCLKVATPEDSKEMLKTPLAAEIREPGRAYLQVGNNEIFELFQSAYSGGPADSEVSFGQREYEVNEVALNGERDQIYSYKPESKGNVEVTQLNEIVRAVKQYCEKANIPRLPGICLPSLPDVINAPAGNRNAGAIRTLLRIGLYDDPEHQAQNEFEVDITGGNMLIIGSALTGKTSMIQQMIRSAADSYTPDDVNIYIIDFASKALGLFAELNHVGGVVFNDQEDRLKTLIKMLTDEVKSRKEEFAQIGITSFTGYREANIGKLPNIIVFIDNFVAFRELYPMYDDSLLYLLREGLSVGVTIVATALQSNGIGFKYISNFSSFAVLYCNDSGEYGSVLDRCRMQPKNVPGRAIVSMDKEYFEMQTYLAFEGEKEIERAGNIKEYINHIQSVDKNCRANMIPEIPDKMDEEWLLSHDRRGEDTPAYTATIGMDYATIGFERLKLRTLSLLSLAGPENTGKTHAVLNIVNNLRRNAKKEPVECYVLDAYDRKLKGLENYDIVKHYTADIAEGTEMLKDVRMIAVERRKQFNAGEFETIENAPLIVTVMRNQQFYLPDKRRDDIFNGLYRSARELKLLFIVCDVENAMIGASSSNILKAVKEARNLLYTGKLEEQNILDLPTATVRENKAELKRGDFFYIQGTGVKRIRIARAKIMEEQ